MGYLTDGRALAGLGLRGDFADLSDGWGDEMNRSLLILSVLCQGKVISNVTALPGTGADGDVYIVPAGDPTNPNKVAVWDRDAAGSPAWVFFAPNAGWKLYNLAGSAFLLFDGSAWAAFTAGSGGPAAYDLRIGFTTTPTASKVLDTIMIGRALTLPANLSGSLGKAGTNPAASFVISINDDGTEIATITVSTAGVFTFATTGGTAQVVAAGSVLTFVAPAVADATIANLTATILGTA